MSKSPDKNISEAEFNTVHSHEDLLKILEEKNNNINSVLSKIQYEQEKEALQVELVKLQQWIKKNNKRVAIILKVEMLLEKVVILEDLPNT